jgi:hypothetical protein
MISLMSMGCHRALLILKQKPSPGRKRHHNRQTFNGVLCTKDRLYREDIPVDSAHPQRAVGASATGMQMAYGSGSGGPS